MIKVFSILVIILAVFGAISSRKRLKNVIKKQIQSGQETLTKLAEVN
jgi:hypothetical protein